MKKVNVFLFAVLVAVFFSGCGRMQHSVAGVTGHYTECIDGVNYLQFTSGVTVKYLPDGKISTCK